MKFGLTKSRFIIGAVILIAIFSPLSVSRADSLDDLKKSIDQKNEEIKKLQEEAQKYRDEVVSKQLTEKTLSQELSRINSAIAKLRSDIALTAKKIQKAELEIEEVTLEMQQKEISINKLHAGLGSLIQTFSEREKESLLEVLAKHNKLSDFFQQFDYSATLEDKILGTLDALRALQKELTIQKAQASAKKNELADLKSTLSDQQKIQEGVKQEKGQLLKTTKDQEKLYQQMLSDTERKQEAIQKEIEDLENELRKRVDPTSLPKQRQGLLMWPTEGLIAQGYGETPFTKSRKGRDFYQFHNGIDIASAVGTPIMAADDGQVMATGNSDNFCPHGAYGRYIVIKHNDNLATMYAHLSLIKVAAGQTVSRGSIIGYMGRSGLVTGPHLHFTVYDARTVEVKLGKLGTCGPLPFGGSIDPMLYL